MSDARDELEAANSQLAAAEAFIETLSLGVPDPTMAASLFLEWLRNVRIARAAAIREALDSEPACSTCNVTLTCKGCCWGA